MAAAAAAVAVDGGIVLVVVGCRPVMSCVCVVHVHRASSSLLDGCGGFAFA